MKVIPLSEAKAHLSRYARLCHEEPVIVTVNGVPSFQLAPLEEEDDLIHHELLACLKCHVGNAFRQPVNGFSSEL
jgi:prevent-host-death family protein